MWVIENRILYNLYIKGFVFSIKREVMVSRRGRRVNHAEKWAKSEKEVMIQSDGHGGRR